MRKHMTKFAPHIALGRLESEKGRRYGYAEIAEIMDDDRQKIRYQLNNPLTEVKTAMIDKWLNFFSHEGMNIEINDLFAVSISDE